MRVTTRVTMSSKSSIVIFKIIIVMDSIIIFFHYKKWVIHWHKKFFKNIHAFSSFTPSSSADIFKIMFQGFWAIQKYFVFEVVFTWNRFPYMKYETSLILVIRFWTNCSPHKATKANDDKKNVCKVLQDLLWVHALITLVSYLQVLLHHHSLVPYSQKYLCQRKPRLP